MCTCIMWAETLEYFRHVYEHGWDVSALRCVLVGRGARLVLISRYPGEILQMCGMYPLSGVSAARLLTCHFVFNFSFFFSN